MSKCSAAVVNQLGNNGFQLHTQARFIERPKRRPLSIGASSNASSEKFFKARPMPKFYQHSSPNNQVLLNDKKLTVVQSFDLETEKRSLSRYNSKHQVKSSNFYDEDKENRVNKKPVKRAMVEVSGSGKNSK